MKCSTMLQIIWVFTVCKSTLRGFPEYKGLNISESVSGPWSRHGLEVIKLEYSLRLKIKDNDWLLADKCPQAANHCALF